MPMAIFQESIVQKYLNKIDTLSVDLAYRKYLEVYGTQKIDNIKKAKEEQYQEGFIKDIFGLVLGYSIFPEQPFNIQTEKKNATDSKKADGAIFQGENVVGVIELKDNKTRNLDAVKDQAFGYKNNHKDCSYVISSNFHKLRFYIDDATEYEEFDLYNLDKESFKRFYLYLRKEGLLDKDIPKLLRQETKFHEENITKSLYKDYSGFKNRFFENAALNNPQFDKILLFKKSQKFLDKLLFVLFAEDKGLVNTNSVVSIVEKWQNLKDDAFDNPKPLYYLINFFFSNLYQGKKDQQGKILVPEFGGEIFAPDKILDNLVIDDNVLKDDLLKLSKYDFNTDVDVNILGHIFEHSLSEIEEVEASLNGVIADKTKGKRKKDGVFYTPKYITKYIVDNTLGKLCIAKKQKLELDLDIAVFEHQKTDGKLNAKGIALFERINEYKRWLMSLKIVDPACGSGAFLNQAVNFLIEEHKYFDDLVAELTNSPLRLFDTDIAILENNIYGVDINEESIEIAKLSLWLRTARPGRKLSNLSNNIKCGNSLIDDPEVAGDKAFNWLEQFPEVFANGGFDVVIGNPPYVRSRGLFLENEKNYFTSTYETSTYQLDLYKLFIEKSCKLLSKKGLLSFITPSVFLINDYDKPLRKFLLDNYSIVMIANSDENIFEDAAVKTAVFVIENNFESNNKIEFLNIVKHQFFTEKAIAQKIFIEQDYLINEKLSKESISIINKLNSLSKLEDFYDVKNGMKVRKELLFESKNDEYHMPFILGKNINSYFYTYDNLFVDYKLENEKLYSNQAFRDKKIFNTEKLIVRQILGKRIVTCYDNQNYFTDQTTYLILKNHTQNSLKYLLSILNSKLIYYFFTKTTSDNKIVFPKIKKSQLLELPIVFEEGSAKIEKASTELVSFMKLFQEHSSKFQRTIQRKFELEELPKKLQDWYKLPYAEFIKELAKKKVNLSLSEEAEWEDYFLLESKKALDIQSAINATDKAIDAMVYELYGLTDEEIRIVEGS